MNADLVEQLTELWRLPAERAQPILQSLVERSIAAASTWRDIEMWLAPEQRAELADLDTKPLDGPGGTHDQVMLATAVVIARRRVGTTDPAAAAAWPDGAARIARL